MFKVVFIALVLLVFINREGRAQTLEPAKGNIEVVQDEKITQLTQQYRTMSLANPEVDGYRVQIFFDSGSNSKNKAASVKEEFETTYPGNKSYLSYKEPYYRVRVGDFRTLAEAVGFQKKIAADYPNSFPVKDAVVQ
jgi:mRNA-degrading endonuclease RelE of RelBE toxin-antitoxin system